MTLVGNNGIEVREENRNGSIYYVCSDGVEFLFIPDGKVNFIGSDGTELSYSKDKNRLISNNGNDAVIKEEGEMKIIEFLDGTIFTSNE